MVESNKGETLAILWIAGVVQFAVCKSKHCKQRSHRGKEYKGGRTSYQCSFLRLQAGKRLSRRDFHPAIHVRACHFPEMLPLPKC